MKWTSVPIRWGEVDLRVLSRSTAGLDLVGGLAYDLTSYTLTNRSWAQDL